MEKKVAVIGAGPMGLAVAYQLTLQGYEPVVYEADDRIGGMSAPFDFDGLTIERYYHFHCTSDGDFFQLLKELKLESRLHWVETSMAYWYRNKVQPWGNPFALLFFRGLGLISKFRYGLFAFLSTKRNDWSGLDKKEATRWIKWWVGKKNWEILWEKLFDFKFYQYADNLSAAWIWSRIRRIGRSRYSLMKEKLGYLEGGSKTFLDAMAAVIVAQGGEIRLNQRIEHVTMEGGTVKGVVGPSGFEPYTRVVSTIALPYAAKIMPDLPSSIHEKLASRQNIAVVCVIVKLSKPLTGNFWLNVVDDSMDIPGIVEYTGLNPLKEKIVYVPYYVPTDHPTFQLSDDVFAERVKGYLQIINPDLADTDFLSIRVNRCRYAQPICEPEYLAHLPPAELPVKGLWVADTSYYYPEDRGISESIGYGRRLAQRVVLS